METYVRKMFYKIPQAAVAPRSRKISTGPGMPTIRDEDGENLSSEAPPRFFLPQFSITSVAESDSES